MMYFTVYYTYGGKPINNLQPVIKICEVDSWVTSSSGVMTFIGDGLYTYEFVGYDLQKEYIVICNAMTDLVDERYKFLISGEYGDLLHTVTMLNDNIEFRTLLIKKILTNKMELRDGSSNNLILYNDDDSSELLKWDVKDKEDRDIIELLNTNSRRSRAK